MAAITEVKVPDIGDFSEVEIIEVLVNPGDEVQAEDPLVTLESDKATMDIPAPAGGRVRELRVGVGDRVSEGDPILLLEAEETAAKAAEEQAPAAEEEEIPAKGEEQEAIPEPGQASEPARREREQAFREKPYTPPPTLPPPVERARAELPHASPSVRRFARELGADLSRIRGSGPKGRILKEDVKEWVKRQLGAETSRGVTGGTGIPPIPEIDFSKFGPVEVQPLPRIRKISGPHLHRAWLNVPHVTHHDEADITDLEAFRKSLRGEADQQGIRVSLLAFAILAVVTALKRFPQFNASLSPDGENLVLKRYFHIGIAVDTPNGLMVPVLRDVDQKSVFELSAELGEVSARAREGKLRPDELQGGCFSISSLGGIGGTAFTPIVNAPEVAILGISRARMTPLWNGEEFLPRLMLPLDLSYDHRVIDGAAAARFMVHLCGMLGDLRRLLL